VREIGLYYPYIHIREEAWLKAAALYWPGLARIVPHYYTPADTTTGRELNDALGFFTNVDPTPAAAAVADAFVRTIAEHADHLRERFRVDPDRVNETVHSIIQRRISLVHIGGMSYADLVASDTLLNPPQKYLAVEDHVRWANAPLTGILYGELDSAVRDALWDAELAVPSSRIGGLRTRAHAHDQTYDWMAVHPDLAWIYKCALSREVARQNRLRPTTDQIASQTAAQEWGSDEIAASLLGAGSAAVDLRTRDQVTAKVREVELTERIALLALHVALPANLFDVPTTRIIKLRQRHGAEFDAFGDLVAVTAEELSSELTDISDPAVVHTYLRQEVVRRFERPLADLRKAMRGMGVNTVLGALNLKLELPAAVATASGALIAGQPLIALAGAAAFGLLGVTRSARQERADKLAQSPVSYLLHVGDLAPNQLVSSLTRRSIGPAER
jgi:Family of unknown function (DUF6236)